MGEKGLGMFAHFYCAHFCLLIFTCSFLSAWNAVVCFAQECELRGEDGQWITLPCGCYPTVTVIIVLRIDRSNSWCKSNHHTFYNKAFQKQTKCGMAAAQRNARTRQCTILETIEVREMLLSPWVIDTCLGTLVRSSQTIAITKTRVLDANRLAFASIPRTFKVLTVSLCLYFSRQLSATKAPQCS